jgi:Ras-related protein Rab-1A
MKKDTKVRFSYPGRKSDMNNSRMSETVAYDRTIYRFKVILLGDIAVGKTSILSRFVDDKYSSEYRCNVGVEFKVKSLYLDETTGADLQIWDTCGEERFRTITRQYYRDSSGIILVFDLTNKNSYERVTSWIEDIREYGPQGVNILLIGNKVDLEDDRQVNFNSATEFAKKLNTNYLEVSAKTGFNVALVFEILTKVMVEKEQEFNSKRKKKGKVDKSHVVANKSITLDNFKLENEKNSKKCC